MTNSWFFPENSGGEFDGFKDAGIEYFAGNPYSAIAREIIQNSLDAEDKSRKSPVKVYFDLIKVPTSKFPGISGLRDSVKRALRQGRELKEVESVAFFEKAEAILSKAIVCLRIADTNTTGLRGPCELGKPFYAFIKARGQSVKLSDTAGGSYGIGKHAPFALSDLRTIFVSTSYMENGKQYDLAQGKSILMSHLNIEGNYTKGAGYFGKSPECMPISPEIEIPTWMRRDHQFGDVDEMQGTTAFVAGFRERGNWQYILLASIISNYFSAIHDGHLVASIDNGELLVSSDSLQGWLSDESVTRAATTEDLEDQLKLAQSMARCLHEPGVKTEISQLPHFGQCRVRLLVEEGLPRRVGILRNGMFITHRLRKLIQFPGYSDFVAVVDCIDPKGTKFLRKMENPEHNDFEPDRLREHKDVARGRAELDRLAEFVRDALKKHAQVDRGDVTELDELSEFFQDPDEEEAIPHGPSGETDLEGAITILVNEPRHRTESAADAEDESNDTGGNGEDGGNGGDGGGGNGSDGRGGSGGRHSRPIALKDVRCVVQDASTREIYFTPLASGTANLMLYDAGADALYQLMVKKIQGGGKIEAGKIRRVRLKANQRKKLRVTLKEDFYGAMRVNAYEV